MPGFEAAVGLSVLSSSLNVLISIPSSRARTASSLKKVSSGLSAHESWVVWAVLVIRVIALRRLDPTISASAGCRVSPVSVGRAVELAHRLFENVPSGLCLDVVLFKTAVLFAGGRSAGHLH